MNNENYRLLEVSENATDEEIRASYERLKAKYNEEKWQDGEAGNNAARMLGRLDTAYAEIMEERRESARNTSGVLLRGSFRRHQKRRPCARADPSRRLQRAQRRVALSAIHRLL